MVELMTLIDAHGEDHGLRVTLCGREVKVCMWMELCEPDPEGRRHPSLLEGTTDLETALFHAVHDGRHNPSMQGRVITGALHWLLRSGNQSEPLYDEDATPCQHFDYDPAVPCQLCHPGREGVTS